MLIGIIDYLFLQSFLEPDFKKLEDDWVNLIYTLECTQTIILEIKSMESFNKECCWYNMIKNSLTKSNYVEFLQRLEINESNVRCFVTKKCGMQNHDINLAHMLPNSCPDRIFRKLGLLPSFKNDISGVAVNSSGSSRYYNFMLLDKSIERAFDMLKISFVPQDILHQNVFYLKIWDPNCANLPVSIGDAADQRNDIMKFGKVRSTIGDYEGVVVTFPPNFLVPRRILNYHSLCCYLYKKYITKNLPMEVQEPMDFTSEFEGPDLERRHFASLFQNSMNAEHLAEVCDEESLTMWYRVHKRLNTTLEPKTKCTIM